MSNKRGREEEIEKMGERERDKNGREEEKNGREMLKEERMEVKPMWEKS